MAAVFIKLEGVQAVIENMKNVSKSTVEKVEKELDAFGLHTVNEAVRRAPVDEGHLKNSITYNRKGLKVEVVVAADYAAYVEFGTKKFAAAYVSSLPQDWQTFAAQFKGKGGGSADDFLLRIMAWVKRKGIGSLQTKSGNRSRSKASQEQEDNIAYIIALRILQNGIKAHPFLYPAVKITSKELAENLKKL